MLLMWLKDANQSVLRSMVLMCSRIKFAGSVVRLVMFGITVVLLRRQQRAKLLMKQPTLEPSSIEITMNGVGAADKARAKAKDKARAKAKDKAGAKEEGVVRLQSMQSICLRTASHPRDLMTFQFRRRNLRSILTTRCALSLSTCLKYCMTLIMKLTSVLLRVSMCHMRRYATFAIHVRLTKAFPSLAFHGRPLPLAPNSRSFLLSGKGASVMR